MLEESLHSMRLLGKCSMGEVATLQFFESIGAMMSAQHQHSLLGPGKRT